MISERCSLNRILDFQLHFHHFKSNLQLFRLCNVTISSWVVKGGLVSGGSESALMTQLHVERK